MAYQTPPTFTDNEIISAAQLNILSANQEFLYGITSAINGPFNSIRTSQSLSENNNAYRMRKEARYLLYRLYLHGGTIQSRTSISIHDSTGILSHLEIIDSDGATSPQNWLGFIDLDPYINDGDLFRVWVEMHQDQDTDFEIVYLFNSDQTVIS